ncbi:DUF5062 family protein [Colwellia sp. MEBiC06753]
MKKVKNEKALLKKAISVGQFYATKRGYKSFADTDSQDTKIECIYRLLVNDKLVIPLPEAEENLLNIKKRLVKWIIHQLPSDHELLQ